MNVSRIQFGVAAVLILAGCGDRGQFQSRTYTPAEKAKFCKTVSAKPEAYPQAVTNACADFMKMYSQGDKEGLKRDTTLDPIIDSTQPAPNPNLTPGGAPGSGKPVDPKKAGDKDSKQGQGGPAAKPNTEKAVAKDFFEQLSDRDAFIKSTLQVLEMGEEGLASEIVKGIDVTVGTVSGTLVLGIDAAIVFEGKTRVLMVPAEPIAYSKDGKIKPLTATLKEFQGEDISGKLKTKVIVDAVCADEKCQNIHVRLQIAADGKVANAVAIVTLANAKYSITRNNFGAKSFGDRLAEIFPAEKVDLSKLKGADDKNGLQTTIKGIEDKKAETKSDTSAKEKEAVEKAAKDAADKAAAEKAAAEKAAADKKASAEKSDLEERIAAAELKVVDDTKKAAPGAMKETVGKTAEAVKTATPTYDSADMGPVISEASAKKAPVTYDKYQAADQRPDHGPAKISGDEARQIALKNDSPDAFYQNVPKTQTAKSVPVAPAAVPAPKAEVKRSNDEARLIESLKNHGVEAHYEGVPQASATAVAEQDSLKAASKGVVEKTSAKTEDDSSMWSKVNTFAETWLNF